MSNKHFKAIEPVVRANSVEDPRMAKWRQGERRDYHDYSVDPERFFDWLDSLGGPPYRYYRIELDGNKANGPEDMIYHNQMSEPGKLGETGYTWVDLSNCEIKDGFPITGALRLGTLMKIVTLEGWDVVIRSLYSTNRKTKGDDFHQRPQATSQQATPWFF